MKKFIASCCTLIFTILASNGVARAEPIVGNGVLATESRPGGPFSAVHSLNMDDHLIGDCNLVHVEIHVGAEASLLVSGESNIVPHVKTVIQGDELWLTLSEFVSPKVPVMIVATIASKAGIRKGSPINLNGMACMHDSKMHFPFSKQ